MGEDALAIECRLCGNVEIEDADMEEPDTGAGERKVEGDGVHAPGPAGGSDEVVLVEQRCISLRP